MSNLKREVIGDFVNISSNVFTHITGKLYLNNIDVNQVVENAPPDLDTIIEIAGNIQQTAASINLIRNFLVPVGTIVQFVSSIPPTGWLICDGSSQSRTNYSALFSVIGTTYGSVNSNSFNVPNFRGRVPFCLGTDTEFDQMGETGGSKTHQLTTAQMPSHNHTGATDLAGLHSHTSNAGGGPTPGLAHFTGQGTPGSIDSSGGEIDNNSTIALQIFADGLHQHNFTTSTVGSGNAFPILPPYIVVQYIIKF